MRKTLLAVAAICVSLACTSGAHADWNSFWTRYKLDWHRNQSWPEPFQSQERELVRAPFRIMINKGVQMQNTLCEYHFDPNTNQLNQAGLHKVDWIVSQPSLPRRTLFVHMGKTQELTEVRIDSVQQAVAKAVPEKDMPPVLATDIAPRGWPADGIHSTNNQFESSRPAPILPASSSVGGT